MHKKNVSTRDTSINHAQIISILTQIILIYFPTLVLSKSGYKSLGNQSFQSQPKY
ncbi:hypothetical protein CDIOL_04390 [Clostridium diolis]|uniref:Transposase n=1 Tax=Clostridium diolis TaxID=223919 RepID=A0AAV3VX32_9CLOT|nr:hypothetical protein CDIOL_04390 [Clostridium diolis]